MYCDDANFTRLFRRRRANQEAIGVELDKIARNIVKLYRWPTEHDREDAIGTVLLRAVERIPDFKPSRQSAFTFFSRVIDTGLLNELERLGNRRKRREMPLTDGM